ncbi:MAG: DUF1553 domain-containing protein [Akkermansiaceae bacterium]|nr:DUF1553 domain-containing protein [Akkermansiaceae bacterium]
MCTARRSLTNTPRQALVTLNDPIFHECAQAFGRRIEAAPENIDERIRFAFRSCLSRDPDPEEARRFRAFLEAGGDDRWTSLAAVLLNLDESLSRE